MARKSSFAVKGSAKPSEAARAFMRFVEGVTPADGCEEQYGRYVAAVKEAEEVYSRLDAAFTQVEREGGMSDAPTWPIYHELGEEHDRLSHRAMLALDAYLYAAKHVHDPVPVPEEDIFEVVNASMERLGIMDFEFSLKNRGLIASKVAQAIRDNVDVHEYSDIPLCNDDRI